MIAAVNMKEGCIHMETCSVCTKVSILATRCCSLTIWTDADSQFKSYVATLEDKGWQIILQVRKLIHQECGQDHSSVAEHLLSIPKVAASVSSLG